MGIAAAAVVVVATAPIDKNDCLEQNENENENKNEH